MASDRPSPSGEAASEVPVGPDVVPNLRPFGSRWVIDGANVAIGAILSLVVPNALQQLAAGLGMRRAFYGRL